MKTELKPLCVNCGHELHGYCTRWDEKTKAWCTCRNYQPATPEIAELKPSDRAALLLIFKTAWNADRGRGNMELTLAYAEAVCVLGITADELKQIEAVDGSAMRFEAKEKPPERS